MLIRYKKLDPRAVEPRRGSLCAAGYDLTAIGWEIDEENDVVVYRTGIAFEIENGWAGFLFPRSSVFKKSLLLTNCVGVIDPDYRGEVFFKFSMREHKQRQRIYQEGERIGQLIVMRVENLFFAESTELSKTERGSGGYGSTGA